MSSMIELPKTSFQHGEWDCFIFANWLRVQKGDRPLPDVSWVYASMTEERIAQRLSSLLAMYCNEVDSPEDGDLVVLRFSKKDCLGTYYQGSLYFMTDVATHRHISKMSDSIVSWWRLRERQLID